MASSFHTPLDSRITLASSTLQSLDTPVNSCLAAPPSSISETDATSITFFDSPGQPTRPSLLSPVTTMRSDSSCTESHTITSAAGTVPLMSANRRPSVMGLLTPTHSTYAHEAFPQSIDTTDATSSTAKSATCTLPQTFGNLSSPESPSQSTLENSTASSSSFSNWYLVGLLPLWMLQSLLCSVFAAWMSVQYSLMRNERHPSFLDTFPIIILILSATCIQLLIFTEILMFARHHSFTRNYKRFQWAKLVISSAGWLVLFIFALFGAPHDGRTHIGLEELGLGILGIGILQTPWLCSIAYATFLMWHSSRKRTAPLGERFTWLFYKKQQHALDAPNYLHSSLPSPPPQPPSQRFATLFHTATPPIETSFAPDISPNQESRASFTHTDTNLGVDTDIHDVSERTPLLTQAFR